MILRKNCLVASLFLGSVFTGTSAIDNYLEYRNLEDERKESGLSKENYINRNRAEKYAFNNLLMGTISLFLASYGLKNVLKDNSEKKKENMLERSLVK